MASHRPYQRQKAQAIGLWALLGRLSCVSIVLFNVFVWALLSLPMASQAAAPEVGQSIAALDLPGISAADICVGGMHEPGGAPEKSVCPQCFPLSNAAHAVLLPGEIALPPLSVQGQRLAFEHPVQAPRSRTTLHWQARAPPASV